jgi:hypothetical protein
MARTELAEVLAILGASPYPEIEKPESGIENSGNETGFNNFLREFVRHFLDRSRLKTGGMTDAKASRHRTIRLLQSQSTTVREPSTKDD